MADKPIEGRRVVPWWVLVLGLLFIAFVIWLLLGIGEGDEIPAAESVIPTAPAETGTTEVTWDANGDGVMDESEYSRFGETVFPVWDIDRNDELSQPEFSAGWRAAGFSQAAEAFAAFDNDSDLRLTREEFFGADQWAEWDSDGTGALEPQSWTFY